VADILFFIGFAGVCYGLGREVVDRGLLPTLTGQA
jgi:hypothetical protein